MAVDGAGEQRRRGSGANARRNVSAPRTSASHVLTCARGSRVDPDVNSTIASCAGSRRERRPARRAARAPAAPPARVCATISRSLAAPTAFRARSDAAHGIARTSRRRARGCRDSARAARRSVGGEACRRHHHRLAGAPRGERAERELQRVGRSTGSHASPARQRGRPARRPRRRSGAAARASAVPSRTRTNIGASARERRQQRRTSCAGARAQHVADMRPQHARRRVPVMREAPATPQIFAARTAPRPPRSCRPT